MDERNRQPRPEQHQVPDVDESPERDTPSQAEGDRDTIEADLAQKFGGEGADERYDTGAGGQGDPVNTPSQAEGNRGEIDEDLRERGEE
jgi:hypothetical protein